MPVVWIIASVFPIGNALVRENKRDLPSNDPSQLHRVEQIIWARRCCHFIRVIHPHIVAAMDSNGDRNRNWHAAAAMSACARLHLRAERGPRHHDLGTASIRPSTSV